MPLSSSVKTLYEIDGRKFVDVEDFLSCYPMADAEARKEVRTCLQAFNGDVEKRVDDSLFSRLIEVCWKANPKAGALNSPIVLHDGWVVWIGNGHEPLIDALGRLFVRRDEPSEPSRSVNDILAPILNRTSPPRSAPNVDLLTYGHAWYVSTEAPQVIHKGRTYRATRADRELFEIFQVDIIG